MAKMLTLSSDTPTQLVDNNQDLDEVTAVLGWRNAGKVKARGLGALKQAIAGAPKVDLDAAALLCDANNRIIAAASVDDTDPFNGAIVHQGDNRGREENPSEMIKIIFSRLPSEVEAVALTLASFTGAGFDKVNRTSFGLLVNNELRMESYVPIDESNKNAALMVIIRRNPQNRDKWEIQKLGELIYVDPHFGGNTDGAVSWKDFGNEVRTKLRIRR